MSIPNELVLSSQRSLREFNLQGPTEILERDGSERTPSRIRINDEAALGEIERSTKRMARLVILAADEFQHGGLYGRRGTIVPPAHVVGTDGIHG